MMWYIFLFKLEEQLASYKKKLDDLRKAKNITILKREREVLEVNAPSMGVRRRYSNHINRCDQELYDEA